MCQLSAPTLQPLLPPVPDCRATTRETGGSCIALLVVLGGASRPRCPPAATAAADCWHAASLPAAETAVPGGKRPRHGGARWLSGPGRARAAPIFPPIGAWAFRIPRRD